MAIQPQEAMMQPIQSGKSSGGTPPSRTEETKQPTTVANSSGETSTGRTRRISQRKSQYLVTSRHPRDLAMMGLSPLSFSVVEESLRSNPEFEIVDTVGPQGAVGMLGAGMEDGAAKVLVVKMTEQKAGMLHQQGQGRLVVEPDQPLTLADVTVPLPSMVSSPLPTTGPVLAAVVVVLGKDNAPLKDAEVYLFGSMLPAMGTTDERGQVTLSMFGETPQSIRALYVKPKSDYWSFYQSNPDISSDEANVVGLKALADWPNLPGFPNRQCFGWGQKAMRLDQLPGHMRGQGIKIAVIDSGAATTHENLAQITHGIDLMNKKSNPNAWNVDTMAHGSHCAGVIAGADIAQGIRGMAPDAEVHVCKLFPGGQVSQLIDALEYCIEKQIDVVNLSLGGAAPSEALEQQILRAKRAGIACIVAAGNSSGPVQYPASSPNVLAVAAIGRNNEFPPDSYHVQTATASTDMNGFFAANFSCHGPEVAVCAPGVAIVSSVPPNNFAVMDGTSMAAPHITGLAALVLAHHADFQGSYRMRNAERVERLFQIIKYSARPVNIGDASRTGYGLPDVLVAVGMQPQMAMQPAAVMPGMQDSMRAALTSMAQHGGGFMGMSPAMAANFLSAYRSPPSASFPGGLSGMNPLGFGPGW